METREKWETVRRLRYGDLLKLFRHRWGAVLPDDDAGRSDLWELLTNVSLAPAAADKKLAGIIEVWAPWMPADEAAWMMEHVKLLTIYERTPTARQLGERLRVTNAERELLKLWQFKPIDMTDEQLTELRKKRRTKQERARNRNRGARSRERYLAEVKAPKPWEVEGISRRTWYRRVARGSLPTIVTKQARNLVPPPSGFPGERDKASCKGE